MCRILSRRGILLAPVLGVLTLFSQVATAAIVFEIDTDGAVNGTVDFNPNFSFGGNTTTASISSGSSNAPGLDGADSIFGGNGSPGDTYTISYTPGVDADTDAFAAGTDFGNGNTSTGLTGGGSGEYAVYTVFPVSGNITDDQSTDYTLSDGTTDILTASILQSEDNNGALQGGEWVLLGTADLVQGTTYTLIQEAPDSGFVSMRASGYMFELQPAAIPEPSSMLLLGLCGVGAVGGRRLRRRRELAA